MRDDGRHAANEDGEHRGQNDGPPTVQKDERHREKDARQDKGHDRAQGTMREEHFVAEGAAAHDRDAAAHASSREGGDREAAGRDGSHDFDFWMGRWHIRNRGLRERLAGCTVWDEFEATGVTRPLPAGIGNEDEFHTDFAGGFVGMTFRFYNRSTRQWALYWA